MAIQQTTDWDSTNRTGDTFAIFLTDYPSKLGDSIQTMGCMIHGNHQDQKNINRNHPKSGDL
jgi:hypothetical protein